MTSKEIAEKALNCGAAMEAANKGVERWMVRRDEITADINAAIAEAVKADRRETVLTCIAIVDSHGRDCRGHKNVMADMRNVFGLEPAK